MYLLRPVERSNAGDEILPRGLARLGPLLCRRGAATRASICWNLTRPWLLTAVLAVLIGQAATASAPRHSSLTNAVTVAVASVAFMRCCAGEDAQDDSSTWVRDPRILVGIAARGGPDSSPAPYSVPPATPETRSQFSGASNIAPLLAPLALVAFPDVVDLPPSASPSASSSTTSSVPQPSRGLATTTAPATTEELYNAALGRPCQPAPSCHTLVLGHDAQAIHLNAVQIDLEGPLFVDHVVVFCAFTNKEEDGANQSNAQTATRLLLEVTPFASEKDLANVSSQALSIGHSSSKTRLLDPGSAVQSDQDAEGQQKLTVTVRAVAVSVVIRWVRIKSEVEAEGRSRPRSSDWYSDSSGEPCVEQCPKISEVAVMAVVAQPTPSGSPSVENASNASLQPRSKFRRRSLVNDTGGTISPAEASETSGWLSEESSDSRRRSRRRRFESEILDSLRPQDPLQLPESKLIFSAETEAEHFERPASNVPVGLKSIDLSSFPDVQQKENVGMAFAPAAQDPRINADFLAPSPLARARFVEDVAALSTIPLLTWFSVLIFSFIVPYFLFCRVKHVDFALPPDPDAEAPFMHNQEDQIDVNFRSSTRVPQTFTISTPASSRASSPSPPLSANASPPASARPSPRPSPRIPASVTESEPEGELDPSVSGSSTPSRSGNFPSLSSSTALAERLFDSVLSKSSLNPEVVGRAHSHSSSHSSRGGVGTAPQIEATSASRNDSQVLKLLYASPLCWDDSVRTPLQQIPFEREWSHITQAYDEAAVALDPRNLGVLRPGVSLSAQLLTSKSLQHAVAPVAESGSAVVLHISAHGSDDCLVLEDGKATSHLLSRDQLRGMLELRRELGSGPRLVVLNACSLQATGLEFARHDVPHVICCKAELRDSTSLVFMCAFYSNLFQGSTVARAFSAAIVALRSSPEPRNRAAAGSFVLLPEETGHHEVLFQPQRLPLPRKGSASPGSSTNGSASGSLQRNLRPFRETCSISSSSGNIMLGNTGASSSTATGSSSADQLDGHSTDGRDESCTSEGRVDTSSDSDDPSEIGTSSQERVRLLPFSSFDRRDLVSSNSCPPRAGRRRPWNFGSRGTGNRVFSGTNPTDRGNSAAVRRGCVDDEPQAVPKVLNSPFIRGLPTLPEDFVGRERDVWSILQHLASRRAVVVCGATPTTPTAATAGHGIGKSAVLDAVHRAFTFQMGGVVVAVHLRSPSSPSGLTVGDGAFFWIERIRAGVRAIFQDCQEQWWPSAGRHSPAPSTRLGNAAAALSGAAFGSALRRRTGARRGSVSHGFHSLFDPVAVEPALEELVAEMNALADLCEARSQEWPANRGEILLLLDECDHLIQQQHFQDAVADVLQRCAAYRVVVSTHQKMVGTAGGRFKVVHHPVSGLLRLDAARLFLRRAQRPLRWDELVAAKYPEGGNAVSVKIVREAMAKANAESLYSSVPLHIAMDAQVLSLVAAHPCVSAQDGNPLRLIELASKLGEVSNLSELGPEQPKQVPVAEVLRLETSFSNCVSGGMMPPVLTGADAVL